MTYALFLAVTILTKEWTGQLLSRLQCSVNSAAHVIYRTRCDLLIDHVTCLICIGMTEANA